MKLDRGLFATALYIWNKIAFCSVIYRTEYFKALQLTELSDRFGKWRDRPVMIEAVQDRTAIILNGAFVYSGRHPEQDTHTKETHPPYTLWLNREGYYRGILGDRLSRFTGLGFCIMSHRHLKSGYKRRIVKTIDFATYLREAFALGATTRKAWMSRWLAPRLVQIAYSFFARAYFKVHHRVGLPAA